MNKEKFSPIVSLVLAGTTYSLEYNMHAIRQFEELTGKNLLGGEINSKSAKDIVAIVWAGLVSHHPELDGEFASGQRPESVRKALVFIGKCIDPHDNLDEVSSKVLEALTRSKHKPKEGAEKKEETLAKG